MAKRKDKGKNEDATAKSAIADLHAKYRTGGRDAMLARTRKFVARYEVSRGKGFRLADRTAARCCWCSRRWTPPARTAQSST